MKAQGRTFSAFFDESGTHADSSTVVVGGYIASVEQWEAFRREWQALLDDQQIKVLHRNHLEMFRGEFDRKKGWTEERRLRVLQSAHAIIKCYTHTGIAAAVIRTDFERVMPPALKRAFGGPYGWAAHDCMVGIGHWAVDHREPNLVRYVFEAGAIGRRQVEKMFAVLYKDPKYRELCRIGAWKFASKDEFLELQPADLYAYEIYKHMDNRIVGLPRFPARASAKDLIRITDVAHYWDGTRLERWLKKAAPVVTMLEERERVLLAAGRRDLI